MILGSQSRYRGEVRRISQLMVSGRYRRGEEINWIRKDLGNEYVLYFSRYLSILSITQLNLVIAFQLLSVVPKTNGKKLLSGPLNF